MTKEEIEQDIVEDNGIRFSCMSCGVSGVLLPKSKITKYIKSLNKEAKEIIFNNCEQHTEPKGKEDES